MTIVLRNIICAGIAMCGLCSSATEPYFITSFDASSDTPLSGWTCHGQGKTAKESAPMSVYFPAGSEAYKVLSFPGVDDAAYSNSTTEEGGKVEEWLVSPEITVPADKNALILRFDEIAIGSIRPGNYDLYLSDGGAEAEDFSVLLHSGRPKGTVSEAVASTVRVPVNGYAGKKIRIAFVNRSSGTALLGFSDISLYDYDIEAVPLIPEFISEEGSIPLEFDISAITPNPCNGFTARLYVDGEEVREYITGNDLSKILKERIGFKPDLTLSFGEKKNYLLEVEFADASLPGFMYEGSVTCAEGFPGICVMEEVTGTWCPACVRGAVSLEKFSDDYPGQFFGIAVHEKDPMTVENYNVPLKKESRITSFPSGWFNREERDDPQKSNLVKRFVSQRLASSVRIDNVYHYISDGTEKLTVLYSPQLCYDTEDADFRAVAVITEDHCKGSGSEWNQSNGYSGATVETVGGEEWWPYFEYYSGKGSVIRAAEMEYNHVAWGIYNDYNGSGSDISKSWKAYTPQRYSITFEVPNRKEPNSAGVQNISATAVTVILLDGKTGQVAGAHRLEASEYIEKDPAGISEIGISTFKVRRSQNEIMVNGKDNATVEVYSINGQKLGEAHTEDGLCILGISSVIDPVIVRIVTGRHTEIFKLR